MRAIGSSRLLMAASAVVMLFLYLPLFVMVVMSFNAGASVGLPFTGFSLDWYARLFANTQIMHAIGNSLIVAAGTVAISLPLGVMAAVGLDRYAFPGRAIFRRIVLLPLILPGVITGISLMNFYIINGVRLSLATIIFGQGTALVCVSLTEVYARLQQLGRSQYEAAQDLGAGEIACFVRVILPNIRGAVVGAALISASISLDEIAVTYLLTGRQNTLPMVIWSLLRREATPLVNAAGTLMVVATAVLVTAGLRLSRGGEGSGG